MIRGSVAVYYAKYYLHGSATMLSMFLSTGVAAAILAMVASTWITKRYCKIKLFRESQIAVAILSVMHLLLVKPDDVVLAFVLYFLLSFVVDLHAPVFWSAIAEAVDYGEVKTGQRVSGLAFGGISFFQKTGMGIAGAVVGWLLDVLRLRARPAAERERALIGIALMLSIIPGVVPPAHGPADVPVPDHQRVLRAREAGATPAMSSGIGMPERCLNPLIQQRADPFIHRQTMATTTSRPPCRNTTASSCAARARSQVSRRPRRSMSGASRLPAR